MALVARAQQRRAARQERMVALLAVSATQQQQHSATQDLTVVLALRADLSAPPRRQTRAVPFAAVPGVEAVAARAMRLTARAVTAASAAINRRLVTTPMVLPVLAIL